MSDHIDVREVMWVQPKGDDKATIECRTWRPSGDELRSDYLIRWQKKIGRRGKTTLISDYQEHLVCFWRSTECPMRELAWLVALEDRFKVLQRSDLRRTEYDEILEKLSDCIKLERRVENDRVRRMKAKKKEGR